MLSVNHILAKLGIRGPQIYVDVEGDEHPRGSIVPGRVHLVGSAVEQRVDILTVSLVEFGLDARESLRSNRASNVAASDIRLMPGEIKSYPYVFTLPDNVPLTIAGVTPMTVQGCRIEARAKIGWRINRCARADLNVKLHPEIEAIYGALVSLGFPPTSWSGSSIYTSRSIIKSYHHPPKNLRDQVRLLTVDLCVQDKIVACFLSPQLTASSMADRWISLTGSSGSEHSISIPRQVLLNDAGKANEKGAIDLLSRAIAECVSMPGDLSRRLLRAAVAPGSVDLLRPAVGASVRLANELLRPADDA